MKVAHLTSAHPPFDTRVFHKECVGLAEAGYEVVLVAPHDRAETLKGVRVVPIPRETGRLRRMTIGTWRCLMAGWRERPQIVHFHDPELIPVGILFRILGREVVYDVHENVPAQILTKHWIPSYLAGAVARIVSAVERAAAHVFSAVVAATPAIAARFPRGKTTVVQNFPIAETHAAGATPHAARAPSVVYTGGLSEIQGCFEILDVGARLADEFPRLLVLAGWIDPPGLEPRIRAAAGWREARWLGRITQSEVVRLLGEARVGIVLDHAVPNYVDGYSTKMFEFMGAGLPIVVSDFPLWRQIVTDAECGVVVDPRDPAAAAAAVRQLLRDPREAERLGGNGRAAVLDRYNWGIEKAKLLDGYARLA